MYTSARFAFHILFAVHPSRLIDKLLRMFSVVVASDNFFDSARRTFNVHVIAIMAHEHMTDMKPFGCGSTGSFFNSFLIHVFPYVA